MKEREVKRSENNPKPPMTPASQIVSAAEERQDAPSAAKELQQDPNGEVRGRAFEKNDFPLNADLLKRFQFTLAGREVVDGRTALRIDFKPVPGELPVHTLRDRFINKAAGRIWVDENEFALVKVDLHLTEPVNVIGGLVGAVRQCRYRFQRERTAEGLWFTKQVNWHLEGRQLFTSKIIDYDETRENVRKAW
ncbi:MAG: hypothetical protein DME26_08700 [Verrucomicrobia bacterium]|nr:MAG: hypothetical protein DME26_08700 [Verrucomicrobiota bacterium]